MKIRSYGPMPTRPCKYCLALQDDSVFADFDINQDGCFYLVRISFDGYGCCQPDIQIGIGALDIEKSHQLSRNIKNGSLETPEVAEILRSYFRENKAALWEDALKEHDLI